MTLVRLVGNVAPIAQIESGEEASDEALAAKGDAESFVLLYRRYLTPIYRYLYARLGNREEAEDVTGAAWERAISSLPNYRPTGPFRAWLFTIAYRAIADHYRHSRRDGSLSAPLPLDELDGLIPDEREGPEEAAIAEDEARRALDAVRCLGREQQEVVTLRYMAGLSYGEIARVVGKREAAVKMMTYRALTELRRALRTED